jgi:hypothetical protein
MSRQIFIKVLSTQFYGNPSFDSRADTCGQTDRQKEGRTDIRKLIGDFHDYAKARKMADYERGGSLEKY